MSSVARRARALAFGLALLATVAVAGPEYRQSWCVGPGGAVDLAFPNEVAPGALLVVGVTLLGTTTVVTGVSDTLGHQFRAASPLQSAAFAYRTQVWFAPPLDAGGPNTVHVDTDAGSLIFYIHEYAGFEGGAELEAMSSTNGSGVQMVSLPVTTTSAPTLLFAYGVSHMTATLAQATPFTARERCSNDLSADSVAPSPGEWTAVFEQVDGPFTMALLAFRSSAADGGADAGAGDDAGVDGGVDAGASDGGALDGGVGGPYRFRTVGCSTSDGVWLGLLVVLLRRSAVLRG